MKRILVPSLAIAFLSLSGCLDPSFNIVAQNHTAAGTEFLVAIQDGTGLEVFNQTRRVESGDYLRFTDGELELKEGAYTVDAWADGRHAQGSRRFSKSLVQVEIILTDEALRVAFAIA